MSEPVAGSSVAHSQAEGRARRTLSRRRLAFVLVGLGLAALVAWFAWSQVTEPIWGQAVLPPGQRVTMANGLSVTAPAGPGAETVRNTVSWRVPWLYDRGGREYDEQVTIMRRGDDEQPIVALASFKEDPRSSISVEAVTGGRGLPPLAYASPDGAAKVYWRPGQPTVLITTAIPSKQAGLIEVIGLDGFASPSDMAAVAPPTASDVNRTLQRVWSDLSIEGLPAPLMPTKP